MNLSIMDEGMGKEQTMRNETTKTLKMEMGVVQSEKLRKDTYVQVETVPHLINESDFQQDTNHLDTLRIMTMINTNQIVIDTMSYFISRL